MALLINLESSTSICSVALSKDGKTVDLLENKEGMNHARLLSVYVEQLLERNSIDFGALDGVAVSEGPGSYTGLRIGVSLAKGLCYSHQLPLIAVSPLKAMSIHVASKSEYLRKEGEKPWAFVPMIDARRMEVYMAVYDAAGSEIKPVQAKVIEENTFNDLSSDYRLVIFGNGARKCESVLKNEQITIEKEIETSASYMGKLAEEAYGKKAFKDVAYFEPFYLKDFIAGISKKNVLGQ